MVENFTAGERIAAPLTPERPVKAPKPPRPPKPKRDKPRGAGFSLLRLVGRVIGLLAGFATLLAIGGGVVGYKAYLRYSADLPDIETLRNYQPRVMSRVYAGDSRLLAELATERRIFVPIAAIPALVKQAFISAEDQNFYTHKGVDPSAIARALIHQPALILADEPTGNLDPDSAEKVLALFAQQARDAGAAAVIVTHSDRVAAVADRALVLTAQGLIARDR
jgi:hypothetical protein